MARPLADFLAESDLGGTISDEFIFFGGKRIARRKVATGEVNYYFADHLGSSRVVTNSSGTILDDADFYPFGGERPIVSTSGNTYKFTGKERDSESGLDFFIARYYSSNLGRFLSPDEFTGGPLDAFSSNDPHPPGPLPYADITNPQSLNKYPYTYNNPLNNIDPDGHDTGTATKESIKVTIRVILEEGGKAAPTIGKTLVKVLGSVGAAIGVVLVGKHVIETLADNSVAESEAKIEQEALESRVAGENRANLDARGPPQPQTGTNPQAGERSEEHTKKARPSTEDKHEKGQARKKQDRGGEKADKKRREHGMGRGKRPPNWKGPWPPKQEKANNDKNAP